MLLKQDIAEREKEAEKKMPSQTTNAARRAASGVSSCMYERTHAALAPIVGIVEMDVSRAARSASSRTYVLSSSEYVRAWIHSICACHANSC
jgi:hypothetical protein